MTQDLQHDAGLPAQPGGEDVVRVDVHQVVGSVYGSDYYPTAVRRHLLDAIVRLVFRRLAMASLGRQAVVVDLKDGSELVCTLQPATPASPLAATPATAGAPA